MKDIFSKIDFTKIFATCLVARLVLAGFFAAPRLVEIVAGIYAVLVVVKLVNRMIRNISKIIAETKWKAEAEYLTQIYPGQLARIGINKQKSQSVNTFKNR